jgi:hypothetical protein
MMIHHRANPRAAAGASSGAPTLHYAWLWMALQQQQP